MILNILVANATNRADATWETPGVCFPDIEWKMRKKGFLLEFVKRETYGKMFNKRNPEELFPFHSKEIHNTRILLMVAVSHKLISNCLPRSARK